MKRCPAILLGFALGFTTVAAEAQTIGQRQGDQQQRIVNGVANGSVTPGEAGRLERKQGSIATQDAHMRARDDGHLTPLDRDVLRYREDRASAHIYRAKHNSNVM